MQRVETEGLLRALEMTLSEQKPILVSGPVSSCKEGVLGAITPDQWEIVRNANAERLKALANKVRAQTSMPVICPGNFVMPQWTGDDYAVFFSSVIDRYVIATWFTDDWAYSVGSVAEFTHCMMRGIPCFTHDGNPLGIDAGLRLLEAALREVNGVGRSNEKLVAALERLRRIAVPV